MDTSMINKIQKSKEYAMEPERATFHTLELEFRGNNNTYHVTLSNDGWSCTCPGFQVHNICPHIMAIEKIFKPFIKREPLRYAEGQNIVSDVKKSKQYSEELDRITITLSPQPSVAITANISSPTATASGTTPPATTGHRMASAPM